MGSWTPISLYHSMCDQKPNLANFYFFIIASPPSPPPPPHTHIHPNLHTLEKRILEKKASPPPKHTPQSTHTWKKNTWEINILLQSRGFLLNPIIPLNLQGLSLNCFVTWEVQTMTTYSSIIFETSPVSGATNNSSLGGFFLCWVGSDMPQSLQRRSCSIWWGRPSVYLELTSVIIFPLLSAVSVTWY